MISVPPKTVREYLIHIQRRNITSDVFLKQVDKLKIQMENRKENSRQEKERQRRERESENRTTPRRLIPVGLHD